MMTTQDYADRDDLNVHLLLHICKQSI